MTAASVEAGLAIRRATIRASSAKVQRCRPFHLLLELAAPAAPAAHRLISSLALRDALEQLAQAESRIDESTTENASHKERLHPEIVSILHESSRLAHRSAVPCITTAHLLVSAVSFLLARRHPSFTELAGLDAHLVQAATVRPATGLGRALLHLIKWREL